MCRRRRGRLLPLCQPPRSFVDLVDLDDIAGRVIEENLLPTLHGPGAEIGIGDALLLQALLEGSNVVRAEGEVPALQRIDRLARLETDLEVLFGKVELGGI